MFQRMPTSPEVATVTPAEAAEILRVNERTVRRWVAAGHLKAIRPNPRGRIRIALVDLDALRKVA